MQTIIAQNFRCFESRIEIPLRPVTVLVGENSTGKSSLLALIRLAWDVGMGLSNFDFNEAPFSLGAYDQIACRTDSGQGRGFSIGVKANIASEFTEERGLPKEVLCSGDFKRHGAKPFLSRWTLNCDPYYVEIRFRPNGQIEDVSMTTPSGAYELETRKRTVPSSVLSLPEFLAITLFMQRRADEEAEKESMTPPEEELSYLAGIATLFAQSLGLRPYAFAPVRTKPRRTYDPFRDSAEPEGSHVPMVLAQLKVTNEKAWRRLRSSLGDFGKASGLFKSIDIKRLGKRKEGGPFQIRINTDVLSFNLSDVGYGVSQVFPFLVDCLQAPINSTFLIQQPEVHLHPKAQAALASFLAVVAKEQKKQIVIETHSDHIVDRLRLELRDHQYLKPDDISLLYLSRDRSGVTAHQIEVDALGNLIGAPSSYRAFFLEEEKRLIFG